MQLDFPTPSPEAQRHSQQLVEVIQASIAAADGWISFADYMQQALYEPGLGYYSAGTAKFGEAGDFVTAPELSPLFSQCVAGQCAQVLEATGGDILELGAGTGTMAADILAELGRLDRLPDRYLILETSADLRERQAATLAVKVPDLAARVQWLDSGPDAWITGVIIGNEVIDALPVQRFSLVDGVLVEQGVSANVDGQPLAFANRPASQKLQNLLAEPLSPLTGLSGTYTSEVCLQLPAWLHSVSDWLEEGVAMFFDYGYPRRDYYLPERGAGTLRCYYRHRAHDDPFFWPGLQDITAWVDFSWLAENAMEAGFDVTGYTTQANFLLAAGLEERVAAQATDVQAQASLAHGLRQLLLPGEMGESIKVMALSKGDIAAPDAMFGRDLRSRL